MSSAGSIVERLPGVEDMQGVDFYVAVFKDDRGIVGSIGMLKARQVTGSKNYIGLPENPEDAVERARRLYKGVEDIESQLVLFHFRFSDDGLADFTRKHSLKDHAFVPVLHKRVHRYDCYDWKVWHVVEDLPLSLTNPSGVTLISSDWQEDFSIFLPNSESL